MFRKLLLILSLTIFPVRVVFSADSPSPTTVINLTEKNTVFLKDAVSDTSMTQVISQLSKLEANDEPVIYLVLDSPGGSVFSGLNLIHYIKGYKKPIHTVTLFAASMAFQIAEANPGKRYILDTGVLMSHPMRGGLNGEIGIGLSLDNRHSWIKEVIETLDKNIVARSNGKVSLEGYKKAYDNELWTTGTNAVNLGYADEVVNVSCDYSLSSNTTETSERVYLSMNFAMETNFEYSDCPLMQSLLKYQVSLINVVTNTKYVLYNKGYTIDSNSATENSVLVKNSNDDIFDVLKNNARFKAIEFYINRNMDKVKGIDWL